MHILAYCDERYVETTREVAGKSARVFVSPPLTEDAFPVAALVSADLIVFNFHAQPGLEAWINTQGDVALSADKLRDLQLPRAVIFMVNCYAGGGMLDALKATHPRAIVGGEGENFGGVSQVAGADLLGLWFRRSLEIGLSHQAALDAAKLRLKLAPQTASVKDALEFKIL